MLEEECVFIVEKMNIFEICLEWFGVNMLVCGIDCLIVLFVGMWFLFFDGIGLICEGENFFCVYLGKVIE